jgi:hypothetical protein
MLTSAQLFRDVQFILRDSVRGQDFREVFIDGGNRKEIRHFATFRGIKMRTPDGFVGIIVFPREWSAGGGFSRHLHLGPHSSVARLLLRSVVVLVLIDVSGRSIQLLIE